MVRARAIVHCPTGAGTDLLETWPAVARTAPAARGGDAAASCNAVDARFEIPWGHEAPDNDKRTIAAPVRAPALESSKEPSP